MLLVARKYRGQMSLQRRSVQPADQSRRGAKDLCLDEVKITYLIQRTKQRLGYDMLDPIEREHLRHELKQLEAVQIWKSTLLTQAI